MKFNVVVGNPPYNNDVYLDFVQMGHKLASQYCCWITPAKWQAKGGNKNNQFRSEIGTRIKLVVYYKDVKDIFDIGEPDGISYYIVDINNIHKEKYVKNISRCDVFNSEFEVHNENDLILLKNDVVEIINKCKGKPITDILQHRMVMSNSDYGTEQSEENNVAIVCAEQGISGYSHCDKLYENELKKYKTYIHCLVSQGSGSPFDKDLKAIGGGMKKVYIAKEMQVPQGHYFVLDMFDTIEQAESFVSYCNTKFMRFMYFIGISASMEVIENWRFVPNPGSFDHIFTDEELYKKYGLTSKEIEIIESVINERK